VTHGCFGVDDVVFVFNFAFSFVFVFNFFFLFPFVFSFRQLFFCFAKFFHKFFGKIWLFCRRILRSLWCRCSVFRSVFSSFSQRRRGQGRGARLVQRLPLIPAQQLVISPFVSVIHLEESALA